MATQRVTQVLCAADPRGSADALDALLEAAGEEDGQVLALVGDLAGDAGAHGLREVLRVLMRSGRRTFWVPGAGDAPVADYLRESYNIEIVAPFLRGLHGTVAFEPGGHILFAGFGGEVSDDPDAPRDETGRLAYPRWEAEYRLKILRELDEHQFVFLFSTPPAHKGLGSAGSEVLAELVATHRPRLVVCGGEPGTEMIGRSLVVAPGSLADGHYAIADLHSHEVRQERLAATAGAG
jgi:Icc-related predicted phosphoesterase